MWQIFLAALTDTYIEGASEKEKKKKKKQVFWTATTQIESSTLTIVKVTTLSGSQEPKMI